MLLKHQSPPAVIRNGILADLDALLQLEEICFVTDRLSRRSFRRWLKAENCLLVVIEHGGQVMGYGLVLLHRGTRLARLYSLAVSPAARGRGYGRDLLEHLETTAAAHGRFFMRLEVSVNNVGAINLYKDMGYRTFGHHEAYYTDKSDALRMQKRIRKFASTSRHLNVPWYQQTTEFTCGPASLMMAMAQLSPGMFLTQELELQLWREATTIFMTSGHGGCHPFGLAIAANRRGFGAEVFVNTTDPLFIEGVRTEGKKEVLQLVHLQFLRELEKLGLPLTYEDISLATIQRVFGEGAVVIVLISTYRLDGRKIPHWVTVTGFDEECIYVHDPDMDIALQGPVDCQHIPIAREDFTKMSSFGRSRLRTAVFIRQQRQL